MTDASSPIERNAIPGASPCVLALREELKKGRMRVIDRLEFAGRTVNGHIDRALFFPVEDRYVGGDKAGQVGQEI
jgi:hypothetical protein